MTRKPPSRRSVKEPANSSVAGEEDPGSALDAGDEAVPALPGTGAAPCHRCGGSGQLNGAPCPTCGGTGKLP